MLRLCGRTNLDDCVTVGLRCSLPRLSYSHAHSSPPPCFTQVLHTPMPKLPGASGPKFSFQRTDGGAGL